MIKPLNPAWLRSLVAVCESGSFTRAAALLDLTQAAVSQHLQRLEAECGPLLIRRTRQLELTPAGVKVLEHARAAATAHQRLQAALAGQDPHAGPVAIASPGSIGLILYPRLLALQQQHPGLMVSYRAAPTADIIAAVLAGRAELGIVSQRMDDERLSADLFARESLCLVMPAAAADDSWPALAALGYIDHPDGRDMGRRLLARAHPGHNIDELPVRGFTNQIGTILDPVARGLGFAVLPRFAVAAYADQRAIRVASALPPVVDSLWLIHRAQWPLSASAAWAVGQLRAQDWSMGMQAA
ncbi:LysR family transcriptional regulator [Massilia eurypsychrophila]|jgi:DNA-binding transcriptional LysR family regulator|uniref:LysR family transcriptional regulator n=1 Tax=Massilia eurypsychrophila TaxID=1485217 RepID=A0A2G8T8F9_9BURK|nr:LysR family transcriptional regulator [Massilia eurypsychrophila]PIL42294.1 LysR family transcriptional regulator [Massilia eurypsychrophila]